MCVILFVNQYLRENGFYFLLAEKREVCNENRSEYPL
jgi:hypothetical protein